MKGLFRGTRSMRAAGFAMAAVFAFSVAGATGAIPDSDDGEIHICYATQSNDGGAYPVKAGTARVIDHEAGKRCERREQHLVINQQGSGPPGPPGPPGPAGPEGPAGTGGQTDYAEFFALMPPDNESTVAAGSAVEFPQDGPTDGGGSIARLDPDTFVLADVGTYRVSFHVSVTEAGQLGLKLNGVELPYTINGRATGTSQIAGEALVETTEVDSVISVVNPDGNSTALTITPLAGGTEPVTASLIIEKLSP